MVDMTNVTIFMWFRKPAFTSLGSIQDVHTMMKYIPFCSYTHCHDSCFFDCIHGSLNVPIEHHPTIRYMVYNGYYKVMSNIPKMALCHLRPFTSVHRFASPGEEPANKAAKKTASSSLVKWQKPSIAFPSSCVNCISS